MTGAQRRAFAELCDYLNKPPAGSIGKYDWPKICDDFRLPKDTEFYATSDENGWIAVEYVELATFIAGKLGLSAEDAEEIAIAHTLYLAEG